MPLVICPDRQRVIDAIGHVLVTGGPGSGKTTVALVKALRHIEQGDLMPGQVILFLSFSRAAVARVIEASHREIPKSARSFLIVQTFHSFFWEILRAYGYLLGAPRLLRLLPPHDEKALRHLFEDRGESWERERERLFREEGLVAFDLFAPKVLELLRGATRIRDAVCSRFPIIVVDEAQDTDSDQWEIIKLLAERSQIVSLADLEQQIFDFRPEVSPERVENIAGALRPLRVDLQAQNHRSPNSEIVRFGNDILLSTPRGAPYSGVSRLHYHPRRDNRDMAIRRSVGIAYRRAEQAAGRPIESIAVIATWNRGVNVIARALTGDGEGDLIAHHVVIDEAPVLLASRLVAFLLEPRADHDHRLEELATGLDLCAAVFRAKGGAGDLNLGQRLCAAAVDCRAGRAPRRASIANGLLEVLDALRGHGFKGEPAADWLFARNMLGNSNAAPLRLISGFAEQLAALQRGRRISAAFTALWQSRSNYAGARRALDASLAEEQLLAADSRIGGIHVMTAHKSKGKEFDAVVIFDDPNSSPLVDQRRDPSPHRRSRKLARVAITRARHHVILLTCVIEPCPLLLGHNL
jgi:DNA helicase-2/ATP-dependent DNA helicase PcrA